MCICLCNSHNKAILKVYKQLHYSQTYTHLYIQNTTKTFSPLHWSLSEIDPIHNHTPLAQWFSTKRDFVFQEIFGNGMEIFQAMIKRERDTTGTQAHNSVKCKPYNTLGKTASQNKRTFCGSKCQYCYSRQTPIT